MKDENDNAILDVDTLIVYYLKSIYFIYKKENFIKWELRNRVQTSYHFTAFNHIKEIGIV